MPQRLRALGSSHLDGRHRIPQQFRTHPVLDELLDRAHTSHGAARVAHTMPEHDGQRALLRTHPPHTQAHALVWQPRADGATQRSRSQEQSEYSGYAMHHDSHRYGCAGGPHVRYSFVSGAVRGCFARLGGTVECNYIL